MGPRTIQPLFEITLTSIVWLQENTLVNLWKTKKMWTYVMHLHNCWGLVLKCYELRTRQHRKMLIVKVLRPPKHYFPWDVMAYGRRLRRTYLHKFINQWRRMKYKECKRQYEQSYIIIGHKQKHRWITSVPSIGKRWQYKRDAKSECQVSVNSTGVLFTYL
jgi:hypothetical protein